MSVIIPPALAVIRAHATDLIVPGEIARRTSVTRSAVASWQRRHPELRELALAADLGSTRVFWWPAVRRWLDCVGIRYGEPAQVPEECILCGHEIEPNQLRETLATFPDRITRHWIANECRTR